MNMKKPPLPNWTTASYRFELNETPYTPDQIIEVLDKHIEAPQFIKDNKKVERLNQAWAFDIETSSFYNDKGEKTALMYVWQLGICGDVIIGRTWEEFTDTLDKIEEYYSLNDKRKIVIYVHNLPYEFQFMQHRLFWHDVFATDSRKPLKALSSNYFEFKCSLTLSGYSLANLSGECHKYPIRKMVGDLDYNKIRHPNTPLTKEEIGYCVNDVLVVMSYIQEKLEQGEDIHLIPLTKTGYVRAHCRKNTIYNKDLRTSRKYKNMIKELTITPEEYTMLKRGFQGGFTHANALAVGSVFEKARSIDFTSSYPAVMVAEQFPMSRGEFIQIHNNEEFMENLRYYCCLFDIRFTNIRAKTNVEHPLSESKCFVKGKCQTDNGRIVWAEEVTTTITEQDYATLREFYEWDGKAVGSFIRYMKGYLPRSFVEVILRLYRDKTELKGVEGREVDYQVAKGMINALFGMGVTDIVKDEHKFKNGAWEETPANLEEEIDKYNKSMSRFLFYPWGVWITAYARRNLFSGIKEFGEDYLYSDTDSIKCVNYEKHTDYIEKYNNFIMFKLRRALANHGGFSLDDIEPKTIKGEKKPLGVWDDEGELEKFKTLGAKRYIYTQGGKFKATIAGVSKKEAAKYLESSGDPYKIFTDGLIFPKENTGKLTHTYIDEPRAGTVVDYLGVSYEYEERSGVHLEPQSYEMSMGARFLEYLRGIRIEVI